MTKRERSAPQRMCCGCREHFDKAVLTRIVKTPSGEVILDKTGKVSGRGAYFCGGKACLNKLKKTRKLDLALGVKVPDKIYETLEEQSHADA